MHVPQQLAGAAQVSAEKEGAATLCLVKNDILRPSPFLLFTCSLSIHAIF